MTSSQNNLDRNQRNALRNVVTQCRRILEDEVATLLEGQFGIHRNGMVEDASKLRQLSSEDFEYREQILAHLRHIEAGNFKLADAAAQLVREVAFTHLNRLCAFKLMEHPERKLIRETVRRGLNSNGFKFYLSDHPDDERLWSGGKEDVAYRHFLVWQGAQLYDEIGALFAPNDPANRLFPKQKVLEQIMDLLNATELEQVWAEDETIGWVYQYFTPKELRDQVRKESQVPRNSYELAFRNQFFTPRYVVRFLTDNTLGRMWYEMLQGDSVLAEQCAYLVRRPTETFLAEGQRAPYQDAADENLSQDEALHRPVYVPYRERKDPRDLQVLDPASGSGHFLLYAFDLLQAIYEEAWAKQDGAPVWNVTSKPLHEEYPTLEELRRVAPSLILRYNLFGIDIDLRATQIAALALWLRAQRAYQERDVKAKDRAPVTRVNIVCAEPMPGDKAMLGEFVAELQPAVLGQLVSRVFDKMKLAGEAGSLLKIEDELRDEIETAKRQWKARPPHEQLSLFPEPKRAVAEQMTIYEVAQITDEEFWDEAESRVLEALREYAERATGGQGYRRRLFADDAARGFAFIDVCRRRYEVVLMNPPFGAASKGWKSEFEKSYPRTKNDLYAAFVERGLFWLRQRGMLGAITSRTGFFLTSFQKWREEILLKEGKLTVVADLGMGVLDTAMVETAAYCVERVA